jgi:hypothetical protein
MELTVHGERFDVASLGSQDIVVRDARRVPAGQGTLRLVVARKTTIFHINLLHGIDPSLREQTYQLLGTVEEAAA